MNINGKGLIQGNHFRQTMPGPWEHVTRLIVPCEFRVWHQTVAHCQRQASPETSLGIIKAHFVKVYPQLHMHTHRRGDNWYTYPHAIIIYALARVMPIWHMQFPLVGQDCADRTSAQGSHVGVYFLISGSQSRHRIIKNDSVIWIYSALITVCLIMDIYHIRYHPLKLISQCSHSYYFKSVR